MSFSESFPMKCHVFTSNVFLISENKSGEIRRITECGQNMLGRFFMAHDEELSASYLKPTILLKSEE